MKKFNPFKNKKTKENDEHIDEQADSTLSPWQKANLKFLKNNEDVEEEEKEETFTETTVDSADDDLFEQKTPQKRDTKIKRYMKPTDFEEGEEPDDSWLKVLPLSDNDEEKKDQVKEDKDEKVDATRQLLELEKEMIQGEVEEPDEEEEEEPQPPKKRGLSKRVKWQVGVLGGILALALVITLYYATPLSHLNRITVTGNQLISSQEIMKASHLKSGKGIWKQYHQRNQDAAAIKKAYPGLKSVTMHLSGLNNINIHVEEYPLSGYLIVDKIKYSPILSNGTILSKMKLKKKPSGVLYANFKQGEFLSKVIASYEKVPDNVRNLIQQIILTPSDGNNELVTLYMKDGNQVKVSGTEIGKKLKYYNQVTSQMSDKGIVDMEVGIYSYPYGNENAERRKSTSVADGTVVTTPTEDSTEETSQEVVIPEN